MHSVLNQPVSPPPLTSMLPLLYMAFALHVYFNTFFWEKKGSPMLIFFLLTVIQCLQFLTNTMRPSSLWKLLGQCLCSNRGPEQLSGAGRVAGTGRSTA